MDDELLKAARQMYLTIVSYSGICLDPCEHDDCQAILSSAAYWLEVDPLSGKLDNGHSRFDEDIEPVLYDYLFEDMDDENFDD